MMELNKDNLNKGLLLVVSGPSGTGKGTICNALLKKLPDLNLSISATTRPPRKGEEDGKNYYFISQEKFKEMQDNDEFLETATVYGNNYGTPKKPVLDLLKQGKDIILEIDIQGALQVKKNYPEGVFAFLVPPSLKELEQRITKRGTDSKDCIVKRLSCAKTEISYYKDYDYNIINDNIDEAVKNLITIIAAEKLKPLRKSKEIEQIILESEL